MRLYPRRWPHHLITTILIPNAGAAEVAVVNAVPTAPPPISPPPPTTPPSSSSGLSTGGVIGIVCGGLALIAVGAFVTTRQGGDSDGKKVKQVQMSSTVA